MYVFFLANKKKLIGFIYVMQVKDYTDNKEANRIKGSRITRLILYVDNNQLLINIPNNVILDL